MSTTLVYADPGTVITLAGGVLHSWHANSCRRPDAAPVGDPAEVARFARWNLPPTVTRLDFAGMVDRAVERVAIQDAA